MAETSATHKIRILEDAILVKQAELQKVEEILELLEETGKAITSEIELENLVQRITDKATQLSNAQFGAFFYNTVADQKQLLLYVVSGVPREMFSKFPLPRVTKIFQPTFEGTKTVRYDDVTQSKNFGHNPPHHGMPKGHPPVRSYLAVPVINPITHEAIGGLFLGHEKPGVFTDKEQKLVEGIALQGAIAMGNARLFEEKKKTEILLQQQTEAYKNIFNSTFDGVFILDKEGVIVEVNDMGAVMYGKRVEQLKGKLVSVILQAYDPRFLSFGNLEKTESFYFESQGIKQTGQVIDLECRARLFLYHGTGHILLFVRDITQIVQAKSELRKSKNFSETIAETSPVVLFLTNNKGALEYINSLWFLWTGEYDIREHQGFNWLNFIHEEDRRNFKKQFRDSFIKKGALDVDIRIWNLNKETRWVNVQAEPYKNHDSFFSGLAGSVMDITLRKNAEEELRVKDEKVKEQLELQVWERTAQLEKINYELLQFTSIASHDLKEPIRKISIFSKILKERISQLLQADDQKYLDNVIRSASRMTSLINDLLNFSRLSHIQYPHFTKVNLNTLLASIIEDLELVIKEKQAGIKADPLPEIDAIGVQMNQVFQNLLINSLKFMDKNRPMTISITCEEVDKKRFKIIYSDTGIGFNDKFSEKIFEVFQRLHTKDTFEGTGIGLSIVKKIIDLHHGQIIARGKENEGATFEIILPYKQKAGN